MTDKLTEPEAVELVSADADGAHSTGPESGAVGSVARGPEPVVPVDGVRSAGVASGAGGRGAVIAVDGVLAALGDSTRRVVVELLATGGGRTATSLAGELPVTRQAVVQHLAVLRDAGLVESRREGREVRFELRPTALTATAAWMADVAARWDHRLATLKELVETKEVMETKEAVQTVVAGGSAVPGEITQEG
jgi:DNA-binding transcriptional ArsR family regulator